MTAHADPTRTIAVTDYWSRYEHLATPFPTESEVFERMRAELRPGARVLDIGVGSGRAIRILHDYEPEAEYYGVDLAIAPAGVTPPCPMAAGDARRLPFPDDTFDLVFSIGCIEHFAESEQSVREHARVVKPGGLVLLTVSRLGLTTPLRWMRYYTLGKHRHGSFEATTGRSLRTATVGRWLQQGGLEIEQATGIGVPPSDPRNRLSRRTLKRVLPASWWQPFTLCAARKPLPR